MLRYKLLLLNPVVQWQSTRLVRGKSSVQFLAALHLLAVGTAKCDGSNIESDFHLSYTHRHTDTHTDTQTHRHSDT